MSRPSRRRALQLIAAAGGLALTAPGSSAAARRDARQLRRWDGIALGARASMALYHPDGEKAEQLIRGAVDEIRRLERIFSLYRPDSALSRLNREGALEAPPPELVRLLSETRRYGELTGGAFDVTVQPLWMLYQRHFANPGADPAGPPRDAVRHALDLVDYRAVAVDSGRIALGRPGMGLTLNGIAQGFVTDRIAERLRAGGMDSVLIDLGEIRGQGQHPDGRPWSIGLEDPFAGGVARRIEIGDAAVATSAGHGMRFDRTGRHNHLFDPRTGYSPGIMGSVSVVAPTATAADALSTALTVMNPAAGSDLVGQMPKISAHVTFADGSRETWVGQPA